MKKFLMLMFVIVTAFSVLCTSAAVAESYGNSDFLSVYLPASEKFDLAVSPTESGITVEMEYTGNYGSAGIFASLSYKTPGGDVILQDIRKMETDTIAPFSSEGFVIDGQYASFNNIYVTFIDSASLRPCTKPLNIESLYNTGFSLYQAEGIVKKVNAEEGKLTFEPACDVYDSFGNVLMSSGKVYNLVCDNADEYEQYFMLRADIRFDYCGEYVLAEASVSPLNREFEIESNQIDERYSVIGDRDAVVRYYMTDYYQYEKYDIYTSDDAMMYVNGNIIDNKDLYEYFYEEATFRFIENTGDDFYDVVLVTVYEHGIAEALTYDGSDFCKVTLSGGRNIYLDMADSDLSITISDINGNSLGINDIKLGDMLAMVVGDYISRDDIYPNSARHFEEKIHVICLGNKTVEGMITECSETTVWVDDVPYDIGSFIDDNYDLVFDEYGNAQLGLEGFFHISINDNLIGFTPYPLNRNYGYILQTNYKTSGFDEGWQIKMLTEEGICVYPLRLTVKINDDSYHTEYDADLISEFFEEFTEKDEHKNNVSGRIVEFKVSSDGYISKLTFLDTITTIRETEDEYNESRGRIYPCYMAPDITLFDLTADDADSSRVAGVENLVDENIYTVCFADNEDDGWKFAAITEGELYYEPEDDGEDEGDDVVSSVAYGYLLRTQYNDSGFSPYWLAKMLTEDGVAVYNFSRNVSIDGQTYRSENFGANFEYFAGLTQRNNHKENVADRLVEYKLDSEGYINELNFVGVSETAVSGICFKDDNKIGRTALSDNVKVFNIAFSDEEETVVQDKSCLVDGCNYEGYVYYASGSTSADVFVITDRALFSSASGLMYVESVTNSVYDGESAVIVNYYTDGNSETQSAIFVDYLSEKADSTGVDFGALSKGDVFMANTNPEGVVSEYIVIAQMEGERLLPDIDAMNYLESLDEDVAFAYGYVSDVDRRGNIYLESEYMTESSLNDFSPYENTNEYTFNVTLKNPNVQVAPWDSYGVDMADGDVCYYMFVKFYDGDPVDIYSIGYPQSIPQ